jgi:hypothetical protein
VKAQSRTFLLQQTPDLEQDRHGRNDASVIHVPFLVQRSKTRDLTDKLVQGKTKVQGTQRVTLLNSQTGRDDLTMVIQQSGLLTVTPVGPVCQAWELFAGGLNEGRAAHLVESIAEVDFQQPEVGLCVPLKRVSKAVGDNLDAPRATNSVVEAFEVGTDFFLGTKTKALCGQPTKWVPAAKRANSSTLLLQDTPPARKGFKKAGASPLESWFTAATRAPENDHDSAW